MSKFTKQPFVMQAAQASLFVPLIVIFINFASRSVKDVPGSATIAIGVFCQLLILTGFALGIIALVGIKKHGKKGLLWRGILGIILNGILIFSSITAIFAIQRIRNYYKTPHYTLKLPKEFIKYKEGKNKKNIIEAFRIGNPKENDPGILFLVEDLGGKIEKADFSKLLKKNPNVSLLKMPWKKYEIDVFRITENVNGVEVLTFNAQIPLTPKALQLKAMGLKKKEKEIKQILQTAINNVDGKSNW